LKTKVQIFFDVFLLVTLYGSFCQQTEHPAKASSSFGILCQMTLPQNCDLGHANVSPASLCNAGPTMCYSLVQEDETTT